MAVRGAPKRGALLVLALGAGSVAFAAGLTVSSNPLASGSVTTSACDADGVTVTQVVSGTSVASVDVGGIDAACAGGTLKVTVYNRTDAAKEGTATIPTGTAPYSASVTLSAAVPLNDVHFVAVALAEP